MEFAKLVATQSYCDRAKVGCVIIDETTKNIIAFGYNGTVSGEPNVCEVNDKTLPTVLHAETNALSKLTKSTQSSQNAILFCTLSPCLECSKIIVQCGISQVFYLDTYNNPNSELALNFLSKHLKVWNYQKYLEHE